MDRLTEMEAFVQVVDHGGFTDAARKIGLVEVGGLQARLRARGAAGGQAAEPHDAAGQPDRGRSRLLRPGPLGAGRGQRGRQHGDRDAGDAEGLAPDLGAGQLRGQAGLAGGGGVPVPLSRRSTSTWCSRTASSSWSPRGSTSRSGSATCRQLAEGPQARRGAQRDRGVAGLPRRDGHAADDRRPERAPAAPLLAALAPATSGGCAALPGEERQIRVGGRLTVNNGDGADARGRGRASASRRSRPSCSATP